jgi:threonine/homoserine/homoserine lactone efflux protein
MTLVTWLVYAAAVLVLTVSPGPSVLMAVSTSIEHGSRRAIIAALGSTTAIGLIMLLSMLGLGAALAASEGLFSVLKWLGAGYLAYLGITSLLAKGAGVSPPHVSQQTGGATALFRRGFLVGASNPKALLFFGALFPQFIDPAAPQMPQLIVLGTTFVFFELSWLCIYAFAAARARRWLQSPKRATAFNRVTGLVFLAAAGLLATTKRSAA